MTAILLPNGKQQYFTTAGLPAVGYKVATFAAGTATPQVTWQDALKVAQNTNPIILDGRGEASIFWDGAYKVQLQDSTGAVIWTQDNLQSQQNGFAASLVPAITNSIDLGSVTLSWRNLYLGANNYPALDTASGNIGYIVRTAAETSAGVTPVSFSYPPGDVRRYWSGSGDLSAALQNAALSNGHVYIPGGAYALASTITLQSNQVIYGDGAGTVLTFSNPSVSQFQGSGITNCTVRDLKIVVSGTAVNTYIGAVAFIANCVNCAATNLDISGVSGCGVFLNGSSYCEVKDNYFHNFANGNNDTGDVYVTASASFGSAFNIIQNNRCYGGGWHGVMLLTQGASILPIQKNLTIGNRIGQHQAYGIGHYSGSAPSDNYNQIIGNYIENIQGNVITGNSGAGIYVVSEGGDVISGNTCRNCCVLTTSASLAPGGIGYSGNAGLAPTTISGNTVIDQATFYGIYVVNASAAAISGNSIRSAAGTVIQHGIFANFSSNVAITGNEIFIDPSIASTRGIFVQSGSANSNSITINGNSVNGCSSRGISVDQSSTNLVVNCSVNGNTVTSASATCIGIGLNAADQVTLNGNSVNTVTTNALSIANCTHLMGGGNTFNSTGTVGVNINGTCTGSRLNETNYYSGNITNSGTGMIVSFFSGSSPGSGTFQVGDTAINNAPTAASQDRWRCTTGGTPGTWTALTLP